MQPIPRSLKRLFAGVSLLVLMSCIGTPTTTVKDSVDYRDSNENGLSFRYPGNWQVVSNFNTDSEYPYYFLKLRLTVQEKLSPDAWNKTKCIVSEYKPTVPSSFEGAFEPFKAQFLEQLSEEQLLLRKDVDVTEDTGAGDLYRLSLPYYVFRERPEDDAYDKSWWEYSVAELIARGVLSIHRELSEPGVSTEDLIAMEWMSHWQLQQKQGIFFQIRCRGPVKLKPVITGLTNQIAASLEIPIQ